MNRRNNYFTALLAGTIVLGLSSCASMLANAKSDNVNSLTSQTKNSSPTTQLDTATSKSEKAREMPITHQPLKRTENKVTSATHSLKTVSITIYQADNQCQGLIPEKVAVTTDNPVEEAVGKVLKTTDSGDFNLGGYRVKVNPKNQVATVDLRLPPHSKRQFISLSNCEQLALFGSLRKTLTSNALLKIKDVRFTNQGTAISL